MQELAVYAILIGCAAYIIRRIRSLKCKKSGCGGCPFYDKCGKTAKKQP